MREISVAELRLNPMTLISDGWMLLTAGTKEGGYNTMTASWGHMGAIWGTGHGLPTTSVYVRPQRYTKEFMDRESLYTLTFFRGRKKELAYLGTHSGRDGDKIAKTGLTPAFGDGFTYFEEAEMVLVCRKLYCAPLVEAGFVDRRVIEENYPKRDYHDMYIGEIVKVLVKEEQEEA